jgi:hypothetical protein
VALEELVSFPFRMDTRAASVRLSWDPPAVLRLLRGIEYVYCFGSDVADGRLVAALGGRAECGERRPPLIVE